MKEGCTYQLFYFHHHRCHVCCDPRLCSCVAETSQGWGSQGPPRSLHLYIFGRTVPEWDNLPTWESKYALVLASWEVAPARSRRVNEPDLVSGQRGATGAAAPQPHTAWESEWNVSSSFLGQWLHCSAMPAMLCSQCPLGQLSVDAAL